jgi:acyl-CoA reductase-like NAD-dependent aldehyde dehydrogenase
MPTKEQVPMTSQEEHLLPGAAAFFRQCPMTNFIGGQWRQVEGGRTYPVIDPSTRAVLTEIPMSTAADVDAAVTAAQKAFPSWAAKSPAERSVMLHRLADAIEKKQKELAQVEALDVGKAVVNAEAFDIPFGVACIRYFADLAVHAQYGAPLAVKSMEARVHRVPYGVCGFIFPWNFPFDLLMWGVIPALAAGNTVVVKPSEITPLSTLFVCSLAEEIGFPSGVLNVVLGDGAGVGAPLASHPDIARMSFTGSPSTGKQVAEACARNLVPCKLELGGKGAAVIFDDVDIQATASQLASAITLNTGQVCCTATRWLIHEKIYDKFVSQAAQSLEQTKIGPSLDRETQMGPLASEVHLKRVLGYLEKGQNEGAEVVLKGTTRGVPEAGNGYYIAPSLLTGSPANICCREEIFGPVAYLLKFQEEGEAISTVNSLRYGLANSVWTTDLVRANRVAEKMVSGNSWINAHNVFAYGLPYGGVNLSGFGGGVNSPETFFDYLRNQTIARPLA